MSRPASHLVRTLLAGGLLLAAAAPLAAQDVTVTLKGTKLSVKGGLLAEEISISTSAITDGEGGGPTTDPVVVTPAKGTTLNGAPDALTFDAVKTLVIDMDEEADLVHFVDFTFGGAITLHAGTGNDVVDYVGCVLGGTQKLFGDDDDDTFTLGTSTITGKLTLNGGDGNLTMTATDTNLVDTTVTGGTGDNAVTWTTVAVKGKVRLKLKQGNDTVVFTGVDIGLKTDVNLSKGDNSFTATGCSLNDQLKLVGANDADTVSFEDSSIGLALKATLGGGANSFALNSVAAAMQVGEQLIVKGGPDADTVTFAAGETKGLVVQVGEFAKVSLSGGGNTVTSTGVLQVGTDFKYSGGGDDDSVSLDGAGIGEDFTASLAAGNNNVTLNDTIVGNNLKITAGSGDDTVAFTGTTSITGKQTIKLGGGDNTQP